jgi:hypothetical protein
MHDSGWSESTILAEWAERECRHLDLIASWETLLSVYETLGFQGPESDDMRLTEFKTIITEINKFLTRMKNGLSRTTNINDAIEFLSAHANTSDMNGVRTRPNIAYNKLKQRWITQSVSVLMAYVVDDIEEGERDAD